MITINGKYKIPSSWIELSSVQFVKIVDAITRFEMAHIDFNRFKIEVIYILIDTTIADPHNNILCENIYRLTEVITFPYKYTYKDSRYQNLSYQSKQWLEKHLPSPDSEDPEIKLASNFARGILLDIVFDKQLLPILPGTKLQGYKFENKGGVVYTNLTAEQYIDANMLLDLFFSNTENKDDILNSICGILYCPGIYDSNKSADLNFGTVDYASKLAVLYNYMAIVEWVSHLEKYTLIFSSTGRKKRKNIIGSANMLYSLAEKGYGTLRNIAHLNLFVFLDLLLKQTIDGVQHLSGLKMKPDEIAKEMNMSIEQVNRIL